MLKGNAKYRVRILLTPGTNLDEENLNKQLMELFNNINVSTVDIGDYSNEYRYTVQSAFKENPPEVIAETDSITEAMSKVIEVISDIHELEGEVYAQVYDNYMNAISYWATNTGKSGIDMSPDM